MLVAELDLCVNHSNRLMNGVIMMHKKGVHSAVIIWFKGTEEPHYTNSGFGVCDVSGHLSGKHDITVSRAFSTGLDCGLPRVSPLDYYADCQATVRLNLTKSKITGLKEPRRSMSITLKSSM